MHKKLLNILLAGIVAMTANVTAQDPLGDSDSFGANARFFGSVTSGVVYLSQDCQQLPVVLGPSDRCQNVAGNAQISKDFRDIGKIVFPPNTFQNTIYPIIRNNLSYFFQNSNPGAPLTVYYNFKPSVTLESPVLFDPALINPITGQPFNGRIDISLQNKEIQNSIIPGGLFAQTDNFTTSMANGITKSYLKSTYGLAQSTVDAIFANKLVVRLNTRMTVTSLFEGHAYYSIRFLGN